MSKKSSGLLTSIPNEDVDIKLNNLSKKTNPELKELIGRQEKLLANRNFLKNLPDKGSKIKLLHERLTKELSSRDVENLLSKLHISGDSTSVINKSNIENLEWQDESQKTKNAEILDSDDESDPEDVLSVIKNTALKKKVVVLKEHESLISSKDIEEIKSFSKSEGDGANVKDETEGHIKYVCEMTVDKAKLNSRVSFKPYRTTITDVHDPSKELLRKRNKHWEVTAATPPPAIHGPIQEISIMDSLKLQQSHTQHMKEIQAKHAAEKLAAQFGKSFEGLPLPSGISGGYRDVVDIQSDDSEDSSAEENSDLEVHDEEPEPGGVNFTVMK